MTTSSVYDEIYITNGSNALAASVVPPRMVLLEGGKTSRANDPVFTESHVARLGKPTMAIQCICAVVLSLVIAVAFYIGDVMVTCSENAVLSNASVMTVSVRQGDSLWSIASKNSVDGCSTNAVVAWIKSRNQLTTSDIYAGQQLFVPTISQL